MIKKVIIGIGLFFFGIGGVNAQTYNYTGVIDFINNSTLPSGAVYSSGCVFTSNGLQGKIFTGTNDQFFSQDGNNKNNCFITYINNYIKCVNINLLNNTLPMRLLFGGTTTSPATNVYNTNISRSFYLSGSGLYYTTNNSVPKNYIQDLSIGNNTLCMYGTGVDKLNVVIKNNITTNSYYYNPFFHYYGNFIQNLNTPNNQRLWYHPNVYILKMGFYGSGTNIDDAINGVRPCADDCEQPDINYFESCDDYDGCDCEDGSVTALNELCYPGSLFPSGYEDPILGCKKVTFKNTVQFDNNFLTGCSSLDYNNINIGTVYNDDVFLGSNDCFIINNELVNTSIGYFDGTYNNSGINLGNINTEVNIDGYYSLVNNIFGGVNTKIKFTYSGLNIQVISNLSSIRSIDNDNYNYYGAAGNNLVCTGGNYDFYNHLLQTSFIYDQNLSGLSKKYYAWIDNGYINIYGYVIYQGINSKLLIPFYGKYFLGDIEEVRRLQEEDKALQSQELSNLGPEFAGVFSCDTDGNGTSSVIEITKCPFTIAFNVVQTSANGMLELGKTFLVFTKIGSNESCTLVDYSGNNSFINSFANIEATSPVALKIRTFFKYGIYLVILGFTFLVIIKQD